MSVNLHVQQEIQALCALTENLMKAQSEATLQALHKKISAIVIDQTFIGFSKELGLIQGRVSQIKKGLQMKGDVRLDCIGLQNKIFAIFKTLMCPLQLLNRYTSRWQDRDHYASMNQKVHGYIHSSDGSKEERLKEIQHFIIEKQIDVNHCYDVGCVLFNGWAFTELCRQSEVALIRLFLQAGVNVNGDNGNPPHYAICTANDKLISDERKIEILKLLIDEGLDVGEAFQLAASATARFPLPFLQMIIDAGADVQSSSNFYKGQKIVDVAWEKAYCCEDPLYEEIAERTQLLIFNGAIIDLGKCEKYMSARSDVQDLKEINNKRNLIYGSLEIRDTVLKEMTDDLVKELVETPVLYTQAVDVLKIMASYVGLTAEDVSKDPVLRKQMLKRCQAKKANF